MGKNAPEAPPRDPTTTVNLQNLGTLLAIFPTKPFYLTEYGYQTAACASFRASGSSSASPSRPIICGGPTPTLAATGR